MFTPPTDSLYKLCAIAGLIMVLWGAAFPWKKGYEAKLEAAQLRAQIKAVGEKAEQLQAQYDDLTREQKALASSTDSATERERIRLKKLDLFIKLIEAKHPVDTGLEKSRVVEQASATYRQIGLASIVLGGVLMVGGFTAWYFRIQRYIDRDMKEGGSKENMTESGSKEK